jgi:hypothetical protein
MRQFVKGSDWRSLVTFPYVVVIPSFIADGHRHYRRSRTNPEQIEVRNINAWILFGSWRIKVVRHKLTPFKIDTKQREGSTKYHRDFSVRVNYVFILFCFC